MPRGIDRFVEGPALLEMPGLNFRFPDLPNRAIDVFVLPRDFDKIRASFRSCAVIVLNSGGLASFQEAFCIVVAQLVCSSPKPLNNI